MTTTSAPPSANGPPRESQYRRALKEIHSVYLHCFSESNRASGAATPWRMLWFVLVMRKTVGLGFGTYLFFFPSHERGDAINA